MSERSRALAKGIAEAERAMAAANRGAERLHRQRITRAKASAVPIEGLPAIAPRCPWCGRPLKPYTKDTEEPVEEGKGGSRWRVTRREFQWWSGYDGIWDRLRCAREFATAAYENGVRLKRK